MATRLFVGSLPWSVTSQELRSVFESCGVIQDVVVIIDKQTGQSKGYGFVEFKNDAEGKSAVEKFNGYLLNGRKIVVNEAAPKTPRTLFAS